jgi:hypothetical protein
MNHEIIDVRQSSQSETYVVVTADGKITLHTETDAQKVDEEITLADLRRRSPRIARQVEAALRRLNLRNTT